MSTQKKHGMVAPFALHQVINRNIPTKYEGEFNHYTSPFGLNGIINTEKPSLWFTHVDYLNDRSEGTYLFDIFREALEDCVETIAPETHETLSSIKDTDSLVTMEYFEDGHKKSKNVKAEIFLCCFSTNDDNLSMWNYYVKGKRYEGYNISFNKTPVEEKQLKDCLINVGKIIYDVDKQKQIIKELILEADQFQMSSIFLFWFKVCLNRLKYLFKHPCFSHEQEIRLILKCPIEGKEDMIQYRLSERGNYIPYIPVPITNMFNKIVVSPLLCEQKNITSLERMLKSRGYDCEIKSSECPIRF